MTEPLRETAWPPGLTMSRPASLRTIEIALIGTGTSNLGKQVDPLAEVDAAHESEPAAAAFLARASTASSVHGSLEQHAVC